MRNLIKQLEQPRHNSKGISVSPTNLDRRAANAIKTLLEIINNMTKTEATMINQVESLERELNEIKCNTTSDAVNTIAPEGDSTTA